MEFKDKTEIEILPIPAPTVGIMGHFPTTMLNPRACVDCNNVVFKNGIVQPRTGYIAYGAGSITGVLLNFFRYQKWDGTEYQMLATTTNVYYRTTGNWVSIASGLNGTLNARASMTHIENYLAYSNGVNAPSKWNGTTWSALNAAHSADDIDWGDYRPLIFLPFVFRLIGLNDNKTTTGAAIRIMYSRAGNFDQIDGTEYSGYIDMTQGMGAKIIGAAPLKNYIAVYKDYCCALLSYIGGASTFAINVQIEGIGLAAKDAIAVVGTSHLFLGSDYNIYRWNGGTELEPIGNPIKELLRAEISSAYVNRSFAITSINNRQVIFFVPINGAEYPTRMWIFNLDDESWSKGTIPSVSGGGVVTTGGIEHVFLGSVAGDWGVRYEGNVVPGMDGWIALDSNNCGNASGGILTIDTTADVTYKCSYWKNLNVILTDSTLKFRAQVVSASGNGAFVVFPNDGTNKLYTQLYLTEDAVYHEGTKICDFDTTDDYHIYRIRFSGTTATLYIDDVDKGSWTLITGGGTSLIIFGDSAPTLSINIKIDYLYYGSGDLDVPAITASEVKHYNYTSLNDSGVAISNSFETGDFVIDKIEHLIRMRRYYGVGLDVKGYSTDAKLTLQYSSDEGVTWSTADERSLTAAYALYNWDFLETFRKIRFKYSDATLSQKWYLRFYGIKQKEGERG